jgi:hypothetical protein
MPTSWSDGESHDAEQEAGYRYDAKLIASATEPYRILALQREKLINDWLRSFVMGMSVPTPVPTPKSKSKAAGQP